MQQVSRASALTLYQTPLRRGLFFFEPEFLPVAGGFKGYASDGEHLQEISSKKFPSLKPPATKNKNIDLDQKLPYTPLTHY
jgi:hypothetical protein